MEKCEREEDYSYRLTDVNEVSEKFAHKERVKSFMILTKCTLNYFGKIFLALTSAFTCANNHSRKGNKIGEARNSRSIITDAVVV